MTETYEQYSIYGINPRGATEQRAVCPECRKRKGSDTRDMDLAVNIDLGVWQCWSANCGWTGSLRKIFERPVFRKIEKKQIPVNENIYTWFQTRGISKETIDSNRITKDKIFFNELNKELTCICFNYYSGEDLINIKYRTIDKHFQQEKNADKIFYGLNNIENETEVIICEGEMDSLSFYEVGLKNAISVPDGAINPNAKNLVMKLSYLDNCTDYFDNKQKIYLATDNDAPGLRLRDELARRLGKLRCWIVKYPENCKDANDILMKFGKDELLKCIENAEPYPVEGIHYAKTFEAELNDLYENGYPNGAKTGWIEFDKHLTIYDSLFAVITGFPSHGKTAWLNELMIRLSLRYGWKWGMFSTEYGKVEILLQQLCEILIGKPLLKCYNGFMTVDEKNKAMDFIHEHFIIIEPEKENYLLSKITDAASYLCLKHGIKGLIIDPWNCILHEYNGDTETKYTEKTLDKLKYFARSHGLFLIIVAHPAKPMFLKSGKVQPPNLYSISGSANWYNKAEIGITVWREYDKELEKTEFTKVWITKVKHKFIGKTGTVKYDFDIKSQRFYEKENQRNEGNWLEKLPIGYPVEYDLPEPVEYFNEPKERENNEIVF